MSIIWLLFIPVVLVCGHPQQSLVSHPRSDNNNCLAPCPRTCSPQCYPSCCSASISRPDVARLPSQSASLCVNSCPRSCSPHCLPSCCASAKPKPDMQITSIEEGETEECGDKGFGSPSDNSADPPGTITIPLPPTMYTPPRPGEDPKELPLPDFNLPASIFQGELPSKSMTLTPSGQSTYTGSNEGDQHSPPVESATLSKPVSPPPAPVALSLPPPPSPVISATLSKPVSPPPAAPLALSLPPPPPPPPPAPVATSHVSGSLPYPKLPPVTASEIPNRAHRMPPLLLPKPKPLISHVPAISLPKPPPIHVSIAGAPVNAVPPKPAPVTVAAPCEAPCQAQGEDPIARKMEKELDARFGVTYGKS